ncbi:MAG TPA: hypothetical protein VFP50_18270 [Anaeromyxobacteraceae bacterium]|nr:hypothetical protein [Anaeromyxobacteraceae bacterium]
MSYTERFIQHRLALLAAGFKARPQGKPWPAVPELDPPGLMCAEVNGNILCCRVEGHRGQHATPFPSLHRDGPVWVYWVVGGPFGSCGAIDPDTRLYCGLERGHEGDHLSPSNYAGGATLAEWPAAPDARKVTP